MSLKLISKQNKLGNTFTMWTRAGYLILFKLRPKWIREFKGLFTFIPTSSISLPFKNNSSKFAGKNSILLMLLKERLRTFNYVNLAKVGSNYEICFFCVDNSLKKSRIYSSTHNSGITPNCLTIEASSTASWDQSPSPLSPTLSLSSSRPTF